MDSDIKRLKVNGYDIVGTENGAVWRVFHDDSLIGGDFNTLQEARAYADVLQSSEPRESEDVV
ncbi:hypothetical protein ACLE20_04825 [Rhizobium sp. YIM 134829]|uniref:hypothetical protein n=1 Tax=Rhizobium sp. YIM 134829 TaxID=3390453 RepID=UPI003977F579